MNTTEHAWFEERIAAYVAGGLDAAERERFAAHLETCGECAAVANSLRKEDEAMQAIFAGTIPDMAFEQRLIAGLRHQWTPRLVIHPMVRKAAIGVAAALVLGAMGAAVKVMQDRGGLPSIGFSGETLSLMPAAKPTSTADANPIAINDPVIRAALEKRLPEVRIEGQSFEDVIQFLQDVTGMNIAVNWNALEAAKIGRKTPITLRLRDVMLKTVLNNVLEQAGAGSGQNLAYSVNDRVFRISTSNDTAKANELLARENTERRAMVSALIKDSRRNISQNKYAQALATLNQIIAIDPTNEYANGVRGLVEDRALLQTQRKELYNREYARQMGGKDEMRVPYADVLRYPETDESRVSSSDVYRYPEKWPDISGSVKVNTVGGDKKSDAAPATPLYGQAQPVTISLGEAFRPGEFATRDWAIKSVDNQSNVLGRIVQPQQGGQYSEMFAWKDVVSADKQKGVTAGYPVQVQGQTGGRSVANSVPELGAGRQRLADRTTPDGATGQADPASAAGAASSPGAPGFATNAPHRKIIRTGQMEFEVDSFDSAFALVGKIVAEEGGFVASTDSQKLPNGKMTGTVTLRVTPEHLDTLVLKLRGLGDLKSQKIVAQDITRQYTDLESELRAARAMEQRLLEIIKTGKGEIKDLVAAEKELGVWREKIEKVEGEIRFYASQVALSTLQISMSEKDIKGAAFTSETELRSIGIETEDVEKAYAAAQDLVGEFKGHVVSASLKKLEAGQFAANLVCDISPANTGPMTDRFKQLGNVARLESERKRTTADGSEPPTTSKVERKDTRFVISLYNLANVSPRQTLNLNLACRDVDAAYRAILSRVAKVGGRVVGSNLNQLKADQTTATINFQVKSDDADALLEEIRSAGEDMEVIRLTAAENPDTANVTTAKRGFAVQIVSLASVAPRETIRLQLATSSVPDAYKGLVDLLNGRDIQARILTSQLSEQDRRNITGSLDFEIRRADLAGVEKALASAGDVFSRNASRAVESENTIDSKVRMTMTLVSADQLAPRETFTMTIEARDAEKAMGNLSSGALAVGGRAADSLLSREANGRITGRLTLDVPLTNSGELLKTIREQGTVRTIESQRNSQVPDGSLARARLDVTISDGEGLVSADKGIYASLRNAMSTSVAGLLWSLQLIVIGLCLIVPWVVVIWGAVKLTRRVRSRNGA